MEHNTTHLHTIHTFSETTMYIFYNFIYLIKSDRANGAIANVFYLTHWLLKQRKFLLHLFCFTQHCSKHDTNCFFFKLSILFIKSWKKNKFALQILKGLKSKI